MLCMLLTKPAVLAELQLVRRCALVFRRIVIALLTFRAAHGHKHSHRMILLTVPPESGQADFRGFSVIIE